MIGPGAFDNGNDCPIIINCNYLADFQNAWPQYAYRFRCADGTDTGTTLITATAITINVTDITDYGTAYYTLEPTNANNYNITWSCSDTSKATIDSNGNITVLANGYVVICVYENVTGLSNCQQIRVTKTPTGYGWIEVVPPSKNVDYTSGETTFNITTENIV